MPSPRAEPSSQDRRKRYNPPATRHIHDHRQMAPQDPSDTLDTSESGGGPEMGNLFAFPGTLHLVVDPTIPSSIGPGIQTVPQPEGYHAEVPCLPRRSGLNEIKGTGMIPEAGSGSPRMSPMNPPRHARPLYHSIDLPNVDSEVPIFVPRDGSPSTPRCPPVSAGARRWSPDITIHDPTSKMSSNALWLFTDSLRLHSLIQQAISSPSFAGDLPDDTDPGMKRCLWNSATDYSVRRLLIAVPEAGVVVDVEPSSRDGDIVRVGDVLRAFKNKTTMTNRDAWNGTKMDMLVRGYY